MSDALNIMTPFGDVAALGQGYAQRADGEHLWLPMPQPLEPGTAIEFVILLADGTPAFAGAGQCLQVSDLGEAADPQVRFETAVGALQFDERSKPVYDYLVAMHTAAAEAQPEGEVAQDAAADVGEAGEAGEPGEAGGEEDYADADFDGEVAQEGSEGFEGEVAGLDDEGADEMYIEGGDAGDEPPAPKVSMIPKGMLQRAAIAMHWKPAPAESPQASSSSGLFQYNGAGLPVPEQPPRPDLDPSQWVQPAVRPGGQDAGEAELEASADGAEVQPEAGEYEGGEAEVALDGEGGYDEAAVEVEGTEDYAHGADEGPEGEAGEQPLEAAEDDAAAEQDAEPAGEEYAEAAADETGETGETGEADEVDVEEPGLEAAGDETGEADEAGEVAVEAGDDAEAGDEYGEGDADADVAVEEPAEQDVAMSDDAADDAPMEEGEVL